MHGNSSRSIQRLRDVFERGFEIADLAEPLRSIDASSPVTEVDRLASQLQVDVLGIRQHGDVTSFVRFPRSADIGLATCGEIAERIPSEWRVPAHAPLVELFAEERETDVIFVESLGSVVGVVTEDDLQKPALRMWIFGIITIVEMAFTRLIDERFPDGHWTELLSEGRLEAAAKLHAERLRRGRPVSLLDCLQLGDKGTIICRDEILRGKVGFPSKRRGEQAVKQVESLRNQLAHSQLFFDSDIQTILRLAVQLDRVLSLLVVGPRELDAVSRDDAE